MGAYLPWGACGLGEVFLLDSGEARPPISAKGGQENDRFPGRSTSGPTFADLPAGAGVRQTGRRALLRKHPNDQRQRLGRIGADLCQHCACSKVDSNQSANRSRPHLPRSAPDSQRKRPGTGGIGISAIRSRLLAFVPRGKRLNPAGRREIPSQAPLLVLVIDTGNLFSDTGNLHRHPASSDFAKGCRRLCFKLAEARLPQAGISPAFLCALCGSAVKPFSRLSQIFLRLSSVFSVLNRLPCRREQGVEACASQSAVPQSLITGRSIFL